MKDIAVVGGGIVGCVAAQSLSRAFPRRVVHIAPPAGPDARTTALLNDSVDMLRDLGVWDRVEQDAAPLRTMRLLDGAERIVRSRPIDFPATEIGLSEFGYNLRNDCLVEALDDLGGVERIRGTVHAVSRTEDGWQLSVDGEGAHVFTAVVAADGRNSTVRDAAGIGTRRWSYDQVALVTTFVHERPHNGQSVEFHTQTGPCTQVPLPPLPEAPNRSSLVCVVRPDQADALNELDRQAASTEISERLHYVFGAVELEQDFASYPLSGLTAKAFGRDGVFLVGEAAHVFPPIGAQGANLGFRDVRDCVTALREVRDPVDASSRFARMRVADVSLRTAAVDALNRSLLADFLPVHVGRAFASEAIARSSFLRRRLMRSGLTASGR